MSLKIKSLGEFKGNYKLIPDREQVLIILTLSALARGKSEIRLFHAIDPFKSYIEFLKSLGCQIDQQSKDLVIEGIGLKKFTRPDSTIELSTIEYGMLLQCILLCRDSDTLYYFRVSKSRNDKQLALKEFKENILNLFNYEIIENESSDETICLKFTEQDIEIPSEVVDFIDYNQKSIIIFDALFNEKSISFEEKNPYKDTLIRLLTFFDAPIKIDTIEESDELARRLAIAQGKKIDRKIKTTISDAKFLPSRSLTTMGDTMQASLLCLMAMIKQGSSINIENVYTNPGKMPLINSFRRMGANIESRKKSTRQNDLSSDLVVKHSKLKGSKFTHYDKVCDDIENIPLLAVAACFAVGKTVIKLNDTLAHKHRKLIENIVINLKKAGFEIGIFEHGIVIKGKDESKEATFDILDNYALAYSMAIIGASNHKESEIIGFDRWEYELPHTIELLNTVPGENKEENQEESKKKTSDNSIDQGADKDA